MRSKRAGLVSVLAAALGCASTQQVHIDCVPETVKVYVDGRLLEESAQSVELRSDQPHKIYVKGPGYEPRLVVLEPEPGADGALRLSSDDVCIDPVPVGLGRELELQVEEEGAPAGLR